METILNGLRKDLGKGGIGLAQAGDLGDLFSYLSALGGSHAPAQANAAALAAMALKDLADGMRVVDLSTGKRWRYSASSTATDTTSSVAIAVTAGGAWLLDAGTVDLKLPIGFGTADAAVLFTVPTGFKMRINRALWEVTTSFTGGASSAIGVSSNNANFNTKGDILGAAGGDVAATLVSTGSPYKGGTLGAKFGTNGVIVLVAGDTVRFDRITSVFTAGAGFVHVEAEFLG